MRNVQELGRACREVEKSDEPFELYHVFLGLGVIFELFSRGTGVTATEKAALIAAARVEHSV